MGEGQSKEGETAGQPPHEGVKTDESLSPAQRAFAESFKSELKKADFPLWEVTQSGQELKYMDVRTDVTRHTDGKLNLEMFWSGELEGLDQAAFVMRATETLAKYNAKIAGPMRECGCMISMAALPFEISEEDALALGHAMWSDFGNVQAKPEQAQQ